MSDPKPGPTGPGSRTPEEWEETTLKEALDRWPERDADFSTVSSLPVRRL